MTASTTPSSTEQALEDQNLIVISVGTDHHPFARLVEWSCAWADRNPAYRVVVQRGTVDAPTGVESHDLIPHDELRRLFASSLAVVSHGGPSTVMDARMAGRIPIVVARNPELGEHVDDHQMRFADHLARHGLARCAKDKSTFMSLLDEAIAHPARFIVPRQETQAASGVVRLGEVLDDLLTTRTELVLDLDAIAGEDG